MCFSNTVVVRQNGILSLTGNVTVHEAVSLMKTNDWRITYVRARGGRWTIYSTSNRSTWNISSSSRLARYDVTPKYHIFLTYRQWIWDSMRGVASVYENNKLFPDSERWPSWTPRVPLDGRRIIFALFYRSSRYMHMPVV